MRKLIIVGMLLFFQQIFAANLKEAGVETIEKVTITDSLILDLLKNTIVPELKSLNRNSSDYDIYVELHKSSVGGYPSKYYLSIGADQTLNTPYAINIPQFNFKYIELDGYTIFIRETFSSLYTKLTGEKKEFNYNHHKKRNSSIHNTTWQYWVIGNIRKPRQLIFKMKKHYGISQEYETMYWIKNPNPHNSNRIE